MRGPGRLRAARGAPAPPRPGPGGGGVGGGRGRAPPPVEPRPPEGPRAPRRERPPEGGRAAPRDRGVGARGPGGAPPAQEPSRRRWGWEPEGPPARAYDGGSGRPESCAPTPRRAAPPHPRGMPPGPPPRIGGGSPP
ncbi:hypothetical protein CesoFtcFv8_000327 [Champsocephalus esox]|uniref:Uncharacterized protein n=1 Tax=Champsocephalus esox TaxID=159716 RepID=A0AAN8DV27_9TELE|nr:hypothetical protein CesoFtcFv8_000327 [Champsocephalus esox]